ncbi:hypothetical protein B0J17DRAFT_369607 [Rhizoctonia solani]|nr:hypothetical protein B0J17DRAFT_369607 [Rhizoctonia solani]
MATVKPVTTVVVEQTTTVFVTSFVTTTVQVQAGETRTRTAMVTSTVTSTGMATHTRTRTSTTLVTLTKTNTAGVTRATTNNSTTKGIQTRSTSQVSLSTSAVLSSTPCPTNPVTLTVTRSAETTATSKFGVKDDITTSRSSRDRSTTKTRAATTSTIRPVSSTRSTSASRSTESRAASTTRSFRATSTARSSRSPSIIQSTTDVEASTSATQSIPSDVTSLTGRGGRTRTRSSAVSTSTAATIQTTETAAVSDTSARTTATSVRVTRSASTVSRFSTSVVSTNTVNRANTRTRTRASSAPAASATSSADPQASTELDPRAVMSALSNDGQDTPEPGQVASLTSRNNFINFCLTQNVPLTNGRQIKGGSCNGVPMGRIVAVDKMPSSKFVFPKNGQTIKANTAFTIRMAIKNLSTGNFVNPATNYYGAPAQTTADGTLIGHSHVVIEKLTSKTQTVPTDPQKFAFFKGLNQAAVGGVLSAEVTAGLSAGEYRIASINSAANHQPALSAVAQRGSNDDISYFTVE